MRKYDCIWLMLCLVWTGTSSCSDKKNSADKQEQGVSTVLPDAKNEVTTQILKRRDFHHELVSNGKVSAPDRLIFVLRQVKLLLVFM